MIILMLASFNVVSVKDLKQWKTVTKTLEPICSHARPIVSMKVSTQ